MWNVDHEEYCKDRCLAPFPCNLPFIKYTCLQQKNHSNEDLLWNEVNFARNHFLIFSYKMLLLNYPSVVAGLMGSCDCPCRTYTTKRCVPTYKERCLHHHYQHNHHHHQRHHHHYQHHHHQHYRHHHHQHHCHHHYHSLIKSKVRAGRLWRHEVHEAPRGRRQVCQGQTLLCPNFLIYAVVEAQAHVQHMFKSMFLFIVPSLQFPSDAEGSIEPSSGDRASKVPAVLYIYIYLYIFYILHDYI